MGKPITSSRRELQNATFEQFKKCSKSMLRSFIHARTFTGAEYTKGFWPSKKGTVEEAAAGVRTMIRVAYDCREQRETLRAPPQRDAPAHHVAEAPPAPMNISHPVVVAAQSATTRSSASSFLKDDKWCEMCDLLVGRIGLSERGEADSQRADMLAALEQLRLTQHLYNRVLDPLKRKHICIEWVALNIPRLSALSVLFGHIKKDLRAATEQSCLLSQSRHFVAVDGDNGALEGAYTYRDEDNDGVCIRSGKATGEGAFQRRHREHERCSKLTTLEDQESKFYSSYPHESIALEPRCRQRRGVFSNLRMYVAIGFERSNADVVEALCSTNGILCWPKRVVDYVDKLKFDRAVTLAHKQLHMVGYLFELHYDLLIARQHNVSQSPGFEHCLGIYGQQGNRNKDVE